MAWTNGRSLKNITKGDLNTSYKYNEDGIRTKKTVNGKTTTYVLEESNIVKETTDGKTTWYMYDGDGDLIGFELNGTSYYYDKNLQGDITGIYDTKGAKVVTYRYDAWGNIISMDGDEELAKKNPFRYRGYYYDEEIGLYYLNSRYYDAEVGRFVNADDVNLIPEMQSGVKGTNLFEYCDNNVVNKADPTGHWPKIIKKAKSLLKKGLKWACSVEGLTIIIDIILTWAGGAIKQALKKGVNKLKSKISKKAKEKVKKEIVDKIVDFLKNKVKPFIKNYLSKFEKINKFIDKVTTKAFQKKMLKTISIVLQFSPAYAIAELLDSIDGNNNGYFMYK